MWALLCFVISCVACADVLIIDNVANVLTTEKSQPVTSEFARRTIEPRASPEALEDRIDNVVDTEHGPVRGLEYGAESDIVQYLDIPYGAFSSEDPFQEPKSPKAWTEVHEKTEHTSRCPQIDSEDNYVGDTDCLTLSIFAPSNAANAKGFDVLFHIHDGSFKSGSGNPLIYEPDNLVKNQVILVLPNYRLGPLGFLCLQNATATGNAGLKDLSLALKWVSNNIEKFGGNSSNIVISGVGTAGALVEYLILSNTSRSFISKAISESGFALSTWALDRNPLETANNLAAKFVVIEKNNYEQDFYKIFTEVTIQQLVTAAKDLNFRPCVEVGVGFITDTPWRIMQKQRVEIPYMVGSANHAALDKALQHTQDSLLEVNLNFSTLLPRDLKFDKTEEKIETSRKVKTHYFGEGAIQSGDMDKLSQFYTDSRYINPAIRGARTLVEQGATVYFYEFAFKNINLSIVNGSTRGDSLQFVFRKADVVRMETEESSLLHIMTNFWVSFIKTGIPSTSNTEWQNLAAGTAENEEWLSIAAEVKRQKGFHIDRLSIWNDIYKNYFIDRSLGHEVKPSIFISLITLGFVITSK